VALIIERGHFELASEHTPRRVDFAHCELDAVAIIRSRRSDGTGELEYVDELDRSALRRRERRNQRDCTNCKKSAEMDHVLPGKGWGSRERFARVRFFRVCAGVPRRRI